MPDLKDQEINKISLQIIPLLESVPLGQALYCLKNTKALLLDLHTVDSTSPRFIEKAEELKASAD